MKVLLAEMSRDEVRQLAKPETVVVIPIEATEQHGSHFFFDFEHYTVAEL